VLTRQQWKGVVDFSQAVDAKIVTFFAASVGTRNAAGVWTSDQARQFLAYTKSIGGSIAAAEFMNEPTFAAMGVAPRVTMQRRMRVTSPPFVLSSKRLLPKLCSSVLVQSGREFRWRPHP
jgi:hypothetical protein